MIVPKKRSLYRYAVDTFIDLLGQVQKRSTAYRCNDIDTTGWNKFVDIYSDRGLVITKEFVKNFCEYGIQSWFNKDIEDEKNEDGHSGWNALNYENAFRGIPEVRQFQNTTGCRTP